VMGVSPSAPPASAIETVVPPSAVENGFAPVPALASIIVQSEDDARTPLAIAQAEGLGAGSSSPFKPPRFVAAAPPPAPRPEPADPLAPIRALSDEEMIALFS
jgi:hypothetical protein